MIQIVTDIAHAGTFNRTSLELKRPKRNSADTNQRNF